jgi:tRNA pseudouridine55 synthase
MTQKRRERARVHGWVLLDKPAGITSTQAVGQVRHAFDAEKAGHAGTLDPLASGLLPIALGEATKTVPYVQDGEKAYRFTVKWGEETATDDAEGAVTARSDARPNGEAIAALMPRFTGEILQRPPAFSAIKIGGERAYDLAREGEVVELVERPITIHALRLVASERDTAIFEAECGKGTYVRALARDMGRALGCFGHVARLRRTRVGPFVEAASIPLADFRAGDPFAALQPLEAGLAEVPCIAVDRTAAARLRQGQSIIIRDRNAPLDGPAWAQCDGTPVALCVIEQGALVPRRVLLASS